MLTYTCAWHYPFCLYILSDDMVWQRSVAEETIFLRKGKEGNVRKKRKDSIKVGSVYNTVISHKDGSCLRPPPFHRWCARWNKVLCTYITYLGSILLWWRPFCNIARYSFRVFSHCVTKICLERFCILSVMFREIRWSIHANNPPISHHAWQTSNSTSRSKMRFYRQYDTLADVRWRFRYLAMMLLRREYFRFHHQ